MRYWFTTSHGNTVHNDPSSVDYVPGEPPKFPKTDINYRQKCLAEGFARVGWPNTGSMEKKCFTGRAAVNGYSFHDLESHQQGYLRKFSTIQAGDYILIPADTDRGVIHFGLVLAIDKKVFKPYINPKPDAYYHYYDIENGDYYECAHRVNVLWAKDEQGEFGSFFVQDVVGLWRRAFGELHIKNDTENLLSIARNAKLH